MDQLTQIVFITVLAATNNLLFRVARLTITNLRIFLTLFKLGEIPVLIEFADSRGAFELPVTPARLTTFSCQEIRAVDCHVHCVAFSRLVAFLV